MGVVAGVARASRLLIAALVGGVVVVAVGVLTAALVVGVVGRADPVPEPDWPDSVVGIQTSSSRGWLELDWLTVVHVDAESSSWDTNAIVAALDYGVYPS